ncbi:MAG: hypothetical protein Q8927_05860 [Bacteroidota bacterium]|nr:hypothetical protein [Bacteroidota bacterium]MDP4215707.1 hypothetical protein [Bacteroidota bacterium]MDP4246657.1 hypothetical protein [Bacteroidota bacterium]MDP4255239.1 hypothetical protein [Bacteroidota bacterium]MDP4260122.1 hypothetical protein [Bacteroidota bacterium]
MKKSTSIILCLALTGAAAFSFFGAYSQDDTIHLRKQSLSDHLVTDRPPHALFMELGGTGLALSMNYDTRFSKRVDGLGIRMGLGFSFTKDPAFITVPVALNYLVGRNGNYFEVGAGLTYLDITNTKGFNDISIGGSSGLLNDQYLFVTTCFGYRRQPIHGGFNFRGGVTPVFVSGEMGILPYISLGFNF